MIDEGGRTIIAKVNQGVRYKDRENGDGKGYVRVATFSIRVIDDTSDDNFYWEDRKSTRLNSSH